MGVWYGQEGWTVEGRLGRRLSGVVGEGEGYRRRGVVLVEEGVVLVEEGAAWWGRWRWRRRW